MYTNIASEINNYSIPYVETIETSVSNDGTFNNFNDLLEKISINIRKKTDKEKIFDIYKDCVPFGPQENKKLNAYIKRISIKEKGNIFDYYD